MTLRKDTLSQLILSYNAQLAYYNTLGAQLNSLCASIQSDPDYAASTSSGTKTIVGNTITAISSSNSAMLSIANE